MSSILSYLIQKSNTGSKAAGGNAVAVQSIDAQSADSKPAAVKSAALPSAAIQSDAQPSPELSKFGTFPVRRGLKPYHLISIDNEILSLIGTYTLGGIPSMMTNVADLAITSIDVIKAFSLDGTPKFILDELQDATISQSQDKQDITGKQGRKINSLKRNKAVTISGTNGLVSAGLLEAQTGCAFKETESTPVSWTDYLVVKANAATTEYKAVGTAGAEIEGLYVRNEDGSAGAKLTQGDAVGENTFTYTPASKALAFKEGEIPDGTEIVVFYTRNVHGYVQENMSDKYSQKMQMYIDASAEDKCNNVYHVQIYFPKADFSGEFSLETGDNQTVHAFEAESLAGSCGAGGMLWTYTVFGINSADAA